MQKTAIKNLQESIHGHNISAINYLQLSKTRLSQELKRDLTEEQRAMIERDIKRVGNIIDQILCYEVMDDYYRTDSEKDISIP